MKRNLIVEIVSLMFIVLLSYAAISKLLGYDEFVRQIKMSPLLKDRLSLHWMAAPAVWTLSALELGIAFLLISGFYRALAFWLCTLMMTAFTVYIIYVIWYAPFTPCACGGVIDTLTWSQHLFLNIMFIVMGGSAIAIETRHQRILMRN